MLNELMLLAGTDIPFVSTQAQINIRQPSIKEISYLGEEQFFMGCELLSFSKNSLPLEEQKKIQDKEDIDILLSILNDRKNIKSKKSKICVIMMFSLLFPDYRIGFKKDYIGFVKQGEEGEHKIDKTNFEEFKEIIIEMFCLKKNDSQGGAYNPGNALAAEIVEKLRKGREAAAKQKGERKKIAILSRYVSILAVGEKKDMNSLLGYTVYQLFDEYERFMLKQNHDLYLKAKLAGAKDLEEVEEWTKDIHS